MKDEQGLSILIASDKQSNTLNHMLTQTGIAPENIHNVCCPNTINAILQRHVFDVMLVDMEISYAQDPGCLQNILSIASYLPVIFIIPSTYNEVAIELVKNGIQEFLLKEQFDAALLQHCIWCSILRKQIEINGIESNKKKQQEITDAVIKAEEKERTILGEELHDNVNQILTSAKLYIEMACRDDVLNKDLALHGAHIINKAIEEIRQLSKMLVNSYFKHNSLKEAIEELTEMITETRKIHFRVNMTGIVEHMVDNCYKLTLYRILQEQLNNIVKHAEATFVEILLTQNNSTLFLSIKDNGKGFDTKQKRKGIGFYNIENRISVYNGHIEINSAPDKGCTLNVEITI